MSRDLIPIHWPMSHGVMYNVIQNGITFTGSRNRTFKARITNVIRILLNNMYHYNFFRQG